MSRWRGRGGRRRRRSRQLIIGVAIIDLLGAGALALAVVQGSGNPASAPASVLVKTAPQLIAPAPPGSRAPHRPAAAGHGQRAPARGKPAPARGRPASGRELIDRQAGFQAFSAKLPGTVGLAIAPLGSGPVASFGVLQEGHAWSTMKVPVLVTVLREHEQHGQPLGPQEAAYARAALERSDNAAAQALFAQLEREHGGLDGASTALQDTLRAAGDAVTTINTAPNSSGFTTWGQSVWSARGEVTFYRALARGCLLASGDTRYVLGLMRSVVSGQRWGAGTAGLAPGLNVAFKGGWGPEAGGYLVRQTAIVGAGNRGYVLSMLARASDGTYEGGTRLLTELVGWIARTFDLGARHPGAGCS